MKIVFSLILLIISFHAYSQLGKSYNECLNHAKNHVNYLNQETTETKNYYALTAYYNDVDKTKIKYVFHKNKDICIFFILYYPLYYTKTLIEKNNSNYIKIGELIWQQKNTNLIMEIKLTSDYVEETLYLAN